jgi:hypothetical protein
VRSVFAEALVVVLLVVLGAAQALAQGVRARTPWGDPDLQGVYTNINEQRVPMDRPDRFAGRPRDSITIEELEQIAAASNAAAQARDEFAFGGRFDLTPSRAWLVVDPPDGRIPALTALGEQRRRDYASAYRAR